MYFDLTPEQEAAKARAAAFVEEVCRPLEGDWPYDDYDVDPSVVMEVSRKFREYGLRGLSVPTDAGGLGAGAVAKCLVYEHIVSSHVMHGALATWSGVMEPHPALYGAPEWQRKKYLRPLLDDEKYFHIHISEPGVGSDAAGIQTTAVRRGDDFVINGVKRWAPPPDHPAVKPEYLLCYAVTDPGKGHRGISMFLVDFPNPGVTQGETLETMAPGYVGRSCDYIYEDCVVPAENMLGAKGNGFGYLMEQLNRNRCAIAARLTGLAAWAQARAAEYARERETFGKRLAERQAIQWMIAESEMDIAQLRLLVYDAAAMLDRDIDARKEVAMAKCVAPVVAARVIDRAIQIHGGLGLVKQTRLTALYSIARVAQVAEGSTEMMKLVIGREVLGRDARA